MRPTEDFHLNGIPVFVAPAEDPLPGHSFASVLFRVGSHDEMFGLAGVTELAHNLIRSSLPIELRDHVSSFSDGLFTEFTISAPDDDFGRTMTALADAITNPDWSKLAHQQDLLMAAERLEIAWPEEQFLACRYGTVGAGTTVVQKFSFGRMQPAVVENWLNERFNKNNAAIVAVGMLGPGTSFALCDGKAFDIPQNEAQPLSGPSFVEGQAGQDGMLAFQFATPIGSQARLVLAILAELIERRLTTFEDLTREVHFSSRVVDGETRVLTGFLSTPPHRFEAALKAVIETVDDIANGLAGREMFETQRDEVATGLLSQMGSSDATLHLARTYLMPALETLESQIDQIAGMNTKDLSDIAKVVAVSALYQGSSKVDLAALGLSTWKPSTPSPIAGSASRLRGVLRMLRRKARLIHSPEGLTHLDGKHSLTVRYDSCSAVIDNGLALTLVDKSGEIFVLHTEAWEHGSEVERQVRNNVPIDLFINVDPSDEERREHATIKASAESFAPRTAIKLLSRTRNS